MVGLIYSSLNKTQSYAKAYKRFVNFCLSTFGFFYYICAQKLHMKYINSLLTVIICCAAVVCASAQTSREVVFNFAEPGTLTPAMAEPGLKQSIDLDGITFTADGVEVTFTASESGNTHVRLYGSYDAGTDLRIYDGEEMTVRAAAEGMVLEDIEFTVSLSGGNADCDFFPSVGEYEWVANTWHAPDDEPVTEVTLTSILQSRMTVMKVTVSSDDTTSVSAPLAAAAERYYTLGGRLLGRTPCLPGIYVRVCGDNVRKIVVR